MKKYDLREINLCRLCYNKQNTKIVRTEEI